MLGHLHARIAGWKIVRDFDFSVDVVKTQDGKQCQRNIVGVHLRRGATLNGLRHRRMPRLKPRPSGLRQVSKRIGGCPGPELIGMEQQLLISVKVDAGTGYQRSQYVEVAI